MDFKTSFSHPKVLSWIEEMVSLCNPKNVHLCDGSQEEYDSLCQLMEQEDKLHRLSQDKRPDSLYFQSHVDDVARVEEATFICSKEKEDAGPTNNWKDPAEMKATLKEYFDNCMQGRTLYIIPFCMGPLASGHSKVGIEITDSPYVVINMRIMARIGKDAIPLIDKGVFIPCIHSVGVPLKEGEKDVKWPCNPEKRCIVHFPEERSIWSFGSGYGGNALLGKKCLALRIASAMAKDEGWLAEHMLILGLTNPQGEKKYIAAAFPSACGKTNLAMLTPTLPGWKIECVGDDIAWMRFGDDGKLYAINPEAGFFGVAPGTSDRTNPIAMKTIAKETIFTNVGLTEDNDVWWEGMSEETPDNLTTWKGKNNDGSGPVSHPNARFTASIKNCPVAGDNWNNPEGVPISAILFGGRRDSVLPLVVESFNWQHGVFYGASISSQMTAAAKGTIGKLRHDPFAMLPFCGYHMGDYFNHWLNMGLSEKAQKSLPKIYTVNWFMKNEEGKFVWPGFGENIRVLKWIFDRTDEKANAIKTPIGFVPTLESIDLSELTLSKKERKDLFALDCDQWNSEADRLKEYFSLFGDRLPKGISSELSSLKARLVKAKERSVCGSASKE